MSVVLHAIWAIQVDHRKASRTSKQSNGPDPVYTKLLAIIKQLGSFPSGRLLVLMKAIYEHVQEHAPALLMSAGGCCFALMDTFAKLLVDQKGVPPVSTTAPPCTN